MLELKCPSCHAEMPEKEIRKMAASLNGRRGGRKRSKPTVGYPAPPPVKLPPLAKDVVDAAWKRLNGVLAGMATVFPPAETVTMRETTEIAAEAGLCDHGRLKVYCLACERETRDGTR